MEYLTFSSEAELPSHYALDLAGRVDMSSEAFMTELKENSKALFRRIVEYVTTFLPNTLKKSLDHLIKTNVEKNYKRLYKSVKKIEKDVEFNEELMARKFEAVTGLTVGIHNTVDYLDAILDDAVDHYLKDADAYKLFLSEFISDEEARKRIIQNDPILESEAYYAEIEEHLMDNITGSYTAVTTFGAMYGNKAQMFDTFEKTEKLLERDIEKLTATLYDRVKSLKQRLAAAESLIEEGQIEGTKDVILRLYKDTKVIAEASTTLGKMLFLSVNIAKINMTAMKALIQ